MAKQNIIKNQSGIAMVIALVMLLALTVIGISSLVMSTHDTQISGNERRAAEALNIADAGVERGLMDLLTDFTPDPEGDGDWSNNTFRHLSLSTVDAIVQDTLGAAVGNFTNNVDGQWGDPFDSIAGVLNGPTGNAVGLYNGPVEFPAGSGNYYRVLVLRDSTIDDEVYLRSYAQHSTGARKIVQLHLEVEKVDAWRNAIFAGRGSGANVIQGGIDVAGSIHILGTGEEGVVFALSGNAGMKNGYSELTASLKNRISDDYIKKCQVAGVADPVECLEAVLRVKRGKIDIGGSGSIGEDTGTGCPGGCDEGTAKDLAGDIYKTNIDSIFANQGFTNDSATSNVYSDNFDPDVHSYDDTEEYDLGDKVRMPQFIDPYDGETDRVGQTCAERGIVCETYKDYIEATSLIIDLDGDPATTSDVVCDLIPDGTGSTPPGTSVTGQFCVGCAYGADGVAGTTDDVCVKHDDLDPSCDEDSWTVATCGDRKGCIQWDPGTGSNDSQLVVEGRVKFSNNCTPDASGYGNYIGRTSDDVNYEGKGILYSEKNVNLTGDLLSYAGTAGAEEYFVQDNLLAVMTTGDMELGGAGQPIAAMGAFYALGNMISSHNSELVGSLMSNAFDMTGGTTEIYYVDKLSDELYKMGMIRSEMVYTFKKYEWEEKF